MRPIKEPISISEVVGIIIILSVIIFIIFAVVNAEKYPKTWIEKR